MQIREIYERNLLISRQKRCTAHPSLIMCKFLDHGRFLEASAEGCFVQGVPHKQLKIPNTTFLGQKQIIVTGCCGSGSLLLIFFYLFKTFYSECFVLFCFIHIILFLI